MSLVINPPVQQSSALTQVEQSRATQEVQAAMVIARKFPRDEAAALDRIKNACTRAGLANSAVYQYARGGTDITGPSIRLAEAIAQQWGNIQFGIRELEQANGESTVEAFAWDLESNTRQVKVFQVPHKRYTKAGTKTLEDPRDIYELVANNGARRLRACILGIIPSDIIEEAVQQCEVTMSAKADTSPEAQKQMLEVFSKFGVTKPQIEARIQRRMDAITPAQVVALRKIYTSLKDGMSKPEEWFPPAGPPTIQLEAAKPAETKKEKPKKADAPPPPTAPVTAAEFWLWTESIGLSDKSVTRWLVENNHIGGADDELTDEEAVKVNRTELEADLS
jgi:hypothetical protein